MTSLEVIWFSGIIILLLSILPPSIHYSKMSKAAKKPPKKKASKTNFSITVFLPMKNEQKNAIRKIEEVLSMDRLDSTLKLLIIDSNSTDGTFEIVTKYLEGRSTEISWEIVNVDHPGKSFAVNKALDIIDSEIMIMLDSDAVSPKDTIIRICNHFEDDQIGAVCGMLDLDYSDLPEYRQRFNTLRLGESALWGTPIFEGSVCAFRMSSIGDLRIIPEINADDSQLALLVSSQGQRTIMDANLIFNEVEEISYRRIRSVRRGQGLIRTLRYYLKQIPENSYFKSFYYNAFYFYVIMPWVVTLSLSLLIFSSTSLTLYSDSHLGPLSFLFIAMLFVNRKWRHFILGVSILIESQVRLFFGQKLQNWNPIR